MNPWMVFSLGIITIVLLCTEIEAGNIGSCKGPGGCKKHYCKCGNGDTCCDGRVCYNRNGNEHERSCLSSWQVHYNGDQQVHLLICSNTNVHTAEPIQKQREREETLM